MSTLNEKVSLALNSKRKLAQNEFLHKKSKPNCHHLPKAFFNVSCKDLALSLLGKLLVRSLENNKLLKGRIVETECYPGGEDKASHSFNGRRTSGNEPMYMDPGTAYVYKIYGIHHCFNISSSEMGGAVLIRALEPLEGIDEMEKFRSIKSSKRHKIQDLCKGPSNLCTSIDITKESFNKTDLSDNEILWLESDPNFADDFSVLNTTRVGISSAAEEWVAKPLRFYIYGNNCVSRRDRKREIELSNLI